VSDLKNKFLYQSALALSQLLFPLITYPWLTRTLGPEGLGKVGYIEFTTGLVFTVFSIGISYYGVREIAKERNNKEARSKLTSQLLLLHLISMLLGILVFLAIVLLNKKIIADKELILLGSVYILAQVFALEWYLQGMEKFSFIAKRNILIRIAGIIAILLLVRKKEDYIIYFGIITASQIVIAVAACIHILRENKISLRNTSFRQHIKPLSWFFLTTSFISIYVFFDTIILGFLTEDATVGYYTLAIRIVKMPLLLLLTFNTILFPRISFLSKENDIEKIHHYYKLSLEFIFTFTMPLCTGIFILSPEIIQLIAGDKFSPSVNVLQILAALPLIICINNFLVLQLLAPMHKEKKIVWAVMAGSICSIILLFSLIPLLKEQGAAYATLVTEFLVMLICLYFSWTTIKESVPVKSILFSCLFSLVAIPAAWLIRDLSISAIWSFISIVVVTATVYFLLQYFVAKNKILDESVHFIKKTLTRK
jgi:O-antigen/teichoic acid export membrane protein